MTSTKAHTSNNSEIKNQFPMKKINGTFTSRTWLLHYVQLLLIMESHCLKILIIFMSDLWYLKIHLLSNAALVGIFLSLLLV